jgi:hypothetical protein
MKVHHVAISIALSIALTGCMGAPAGPTATATPGAMNPTLIPAVTSTAASGGLLTPQVTVASGGAQLTGEPRDTAVHLVWSPVSGARGYFVYRDGNSTPLNTAPLSETTYDDVGLSNGRPYRYSIAAVDQAGQPVSRSAEITVTAASQ